MNLKTGSLALALSAIALGSAAAADPGPYNVAAPREHAAPPPAPVHTSYDIVVNKFGRRIRGSAGTTVTTKGLDKGNFIADFPVDVSACVYVATLGRATTDGGVDEIPGYVTVVGANGDNAGVYIETFGLGARLHNRPFHLLVAC